MSTENKLNQGQIDVLLKLYKFRFGTRELVAESLGRNNGTAIYSRLSILKEHGYIDRRFDNSYKLAGRAAEYYLTPKALRSLRALDVAKSIDDKVIKNSYNDRNASDSFIKRCLKVFAIANVLVGLSPNLSFVTKRELAMFTYMPQPLPDAYMALKTEKQARRYFIEFLEADIQPFLMKRRLRQLVNYYNEGNWDITNSPFPTILLVCETNTAKRRLTKLIGTVTSDVGNDFVIDTATAESLKPIM